MAILIINNCPAFYKINLYNEVAIKRDIFVVFLGQSNQVVSEEDLKKNAKFPYLLLHEIQVEKRNKINTFFKIYNLIKKLKPQKILYGGYIMPELILLSYIFPKRKNVLQTESASETILHGIRLKTKKMIMKRFGSAIASGEIHKQMLLKMDFDGRINVSGGVGIIDKSNGRILDKYSNNPLRFLYVGRLIEIKNLKRLISVFNSNGFSLTIVGSGELEGELKAAANSNISFLGFVGNSQISKIYQQHDIFILPSLSEPWGLVTEEAIYNGCVLLASDRVGSAPELVLNKKTGLIFNPEDEDSFNKAIGEVIKNFQFFKNNALNFDFDQKDENQVNAYLEL